MFKVKNNHNTSIWTREEDILLLEIKKSNNYITWSKLSNQFKNKSPKQCNYRYRKLTNNPFNNNKSLNIIEIVNNCNEDFNKIITYFPNSQETDLENYYFQHIKPILFSFSNEENDIINSLINFKKLTIKNMQYIESIGCCIIKKRLELILKSKGKEYKKFIKLFEETYSRQQALSMSEYCIEEEKIELMRLPQANIANSIFSSLENSYSYFDCNSDGKSCPSPINAIKRLFNYYRSLSEIYFSNIDIIADYSNQTNNNYIYEELIDREKLLFVKIEMTNDIEEAIHVFNQIIEVNKVKVDCLKSLIIYKEN